MKRILLASIGQSPQIITETLYYYEIICEKRIDDVHVITDIQGKDILKSKLLGDGGALKKFCSDYNLQYSILQNQIHVLKDQHGNPLKDLLNIYDNKAAITQIFQLLDSLTSIEDTELIVSVAGGRKTMSVIIGQAMQFYARNQDIITHVIIDDRLFNTDFFYPTPQSKIVEVDNQEIDYKDAQVFLSEIPFVRLRDLYGNLIDSAKGESLEGFIEQAQTRIKQLSSSVAININLSKSSLLINQVDVALSNQELCLYALILRMNVSNVLKGMVSDSKIEGYILKSDLNKHEILDIYFDMYEQTSPNISAESKEKLKKLLYEHAYDEDWFGQHRSKLNSKLRKTLTEYEFSKSNIKSGLNADKLRVWGIDSQIENIIIEPNKTSL